MDFIIERLEACESNLCDLGNAVMSWRFCCEKQEVRSGLRREVEGLTSFRNVKMKQKMLQVPSIDKGGSDILFR